LRCSFEALKHVGKVHGDLHQLYQVQYCDTLEKSQSI
jgi:hypothetical protein